MVRPAMMGTCPSSVFDNIWSVSAELGNYDGKTCYDGYVSEFSIMITFGLFQLSWETTMVRPAMKSMCPTSLL